MRVGSGDSVPRPVCLIFAGLCWVVEELRWTTWPRLAWGAEQAGAAISPCSQKQAQARIWPSRAPRAVLTQVLPAQHPSVYPPSLSSCCCEFTGAEQNQGPSDKTDGRSCRDFRTIWRWLRGSRAKGPKARHFSVFKVTPLLLGDWDALGKFGHFVCLCVWCLSGCVWVCMYGFQYNELRLYFSPCN